MKSTPTVERLNELFEYDSVSGAVNWRHIGSGCRRREAGCIKKTTGYRVVGVDRCLIYAHRIAWAMFYGEWPSSEIDHINCNTADNRIDNLRLANRAENSANMRLSKRNSSGIKGVSWSKSSKAWYAQIKVNGKTIPLGFYKDKEAAGDAYRAAADCYFGAFARAA